MKVILGSALGGLLGGAIAFGALAGARQTGATPVDQPVIASMEPAVAAAPAIRCAPYQEATMARVLVDGREATALTCVDRADPPTAPQPALASVPAAAASLQPYGQGAKTSASVAVVQPVSDRRPGRQAPVARPAVVYQNEDDVVRYEPDRRQDKRSVAKTVLLIGGSAGAGAGVGAMAGGKKGALIGAAIGGGAASIYEVLKR